MTDDEIIRYWGLLIDALADELALATTNDLERVRPQLERLQSLMPAPGQGAHSLH